MRRVPRIPVKLDAVLISEGVTLKETITNIGPQGAFVTVPSRTEVGHLVNLRFHPPSTPQPLELLAQTIRQTPDGVGLEFLDLDDRGPSPIMVGSHPIIAQKFEKMPLLRRGVALPPRPKLWRLPYAPGLSTREDTWRDSRERLILRG